MAVNNVFQMLAQQEIERPERELKRLQVKTLTDEANYKEKARKDLAAGPSQTPESTLASMGLARFMVPENAVLDENGTLIGMKPQAEPQQKSMTIADQFKRQYDYHIQNGRTDLAQGVMEHQLELSEKAAKVADHAYKTGGREGLAAWLQNNPTFAPLLGDPSHMKLEKEGVLYPAAGPDGIPVPGEYWYRDENGKVAFKTVKPEPVQTIAPGVGIVGKNGAVNIPIPKVNNTETWGEPYATNIGGKKAMVQKSNRGQVRSVLQDTSTTVKVSTGGAGGNVKPPAGYRWKGDGTLEAIPGGPAEAKAEAARQTKEKAKGAYDASITVVDKLLAHPGRKTATGLSSKLDPRNYTAGTNAYDFQRELDSFDAVLFLSNIEKMKGMGALSNAEGAKVSAAAGAIKPGMSEKAFESNLRIIKAELAKAKTRIDGGTAAPPPGKGTHKGKTPPKLSKAASAVDERY